MSLRNPGSGRSRTLGSERNDRSQSRSVQTRARCAGPTRLACSTLVASLVALTLGSCGREGSSVLLDLAEGLHFADVYVETDQVDFGSSQARTHLIEGWSWDEEAGSISFVWAVGERSSVWFYTDEVKPLTLILACWAPPFRDGLGQKVEVAVNGRLVGELELKGQRREHRVSVPAENLNPGRNEVEFHYARTARDRELVPGSTGIRPLAAAWDFLTIEGISAARRPEVLEDNGVSTLVLPIGSQVDYHLKAKPGDVVDIGPVGLDGVTGSQPGQVTLGIGISGDESRFSKEFEVSPSNDPHSFRIPIEQEEIVRVSLTARRVGNEGRSGISLHVVKPSVRGAVAAPSSKSSRVSGRPNVERPNIVLYVVDTLRADHLGTYGYSRETSPNLDDLAQEAIVFTNAHAQTSWTRPAVASILTGLSPEMHGVDEREEGMADSVVTLAEILGAANFRTAAFVTNGNVTRGFGFGQGFETFKFAEEEGDAARYADIADWLVRTAGDWVDARTDARPFLLYLHAIHPHGPYVPPDRHQRRFSDGIMDPTLGSLQTLKDLEALRYEGPDPRDTLVSLYDAEIAWDDERLGEFVDRLKKLSLWDNTLFIFVSDHGEEFFDHGWTEHGRSLNVEQLSIPMVMKLPHGEGGGTRSSYLAQQIDIAPTILKYLGLEPERSFEGMSLLPDALGGEGQPRPSPTFASLNLDQRVARSVMIDGLRLIRTLSYDQPKPQFELFDVRSDPRERSNLARERPIAVGYLTRLLREREEAIAKNSASASEQGIISAEAERNLRALGYIQ